MATRKQGRKVGVVQLIASDEKKPQVTVRAGQRLEVVSVALTAPGSRVRPRLGARLCGGSGTCLALIHVGEGDPRTTR
jgi:hypothetical protein